MRHNEEDLQADADFEVVYAKEKEFPFIYKRGNLTIVVNPSPNAKQVPFDMTKKKSIFEIGAYDNSEEKLMIGAQSFVIFK